MLTGRESGVVTLIADVLSKLELRARTQPARDAIRTGLVEP